MAVETVVGGMAIYFQLARFFVVLFVGLVITRAVLMPATTRVLRRHTDKKKTYSLENLVGVVGIFATVTLALQAAAFGNLVTVIGTIAAALTIAIGFGMRDQVGNLVSGLFIQLDSPFVKQDFIVSGDLAGTVQDVKLRETRLRTPAGEKLVIPNNILSNNPVTNQTRDRRTTQTLTVTTAATDHETVRRLLIEAADEVDTILSTPAPRARHRSLDEDKVVTELTYHIRDTEQTTAAKDQLLTTFLTAATEHGILLDHT